ncbi:MAG: gamma-glutamyl-gamma-aminobutyrate hydrolase family protein [Actinobacteria bacterium]|nr:gamma-glutamyl-gamma-aminobutyrate hydrolase family protein [Actinomycetota bacterium]
MRAILIANQGDNDGGHVVSAFQNMGYVFTQLTREESDQWPLLGQDVELVVSLGSDWSVYWTEVAHHVYKESELLRSAHEAGIPLFGVCFGAQILAFALGGEVKAAHHTEIGWFSVDWEPNFTQKMPDFAQKQWFQWHYDMLIPPAEAQIWAKSSAGVQAFQCGRSFGVQFHPEVTPAVVQRWSRVGTATGPVELQQAGIDPETLLEETARRADTYASQCAVLLEYFVAQMHK